MKALLAWSDQRHAHDGIQSSCYDIAFRPDGSQLIAAIGTRVHVYDVIEGDLLHSLKGHKDIVFCVSYARDGKRFASGGADKTVIIWNYKAEGILKYSHNDPVQCLAYNPVTQQLASGTSSDFGIWSPEQKSVLKRKAQSKVLSLSWSSDGQSLALGMFSGQILICDKNGTEQMKIERNAAVSSLQWNITRNKTSNILVIGCLDGTLSSYSLSGKQIGKDNHLGFNPCSICFYDAKFICIGGSNRQVIFCTEDGVKLAILCETSDQISVVQAHPKKDYVAIGCNDGGISMVQIVFLKVHGLHLERYAFRESLTDVVVQNLISNEKIRIKCHDYISKIAIYHKTVAVQVPNRILIYELHEHSITSENYDLSAEITTNIDYSLLVLTSAHVILCQETCLLLYSFKGTKERDWHLSSATRYVKVCGGPAGGEGLLLGLKDGSIMRIWINNIFPICVYSHTCGIRCLDISAEQSQVAAVDEGGNVFVYDLKNKRVVFEEKCADSVAWNTQMEEMLCFAGNGVLNVKISKFPLHKQTFQGHVVGLEGSRVFCLHGTCMQTLDLPLSWGMKQYVESGNYEDAYRLACLGVTEADWRFLGLESLQAQCWNVAHGCFSRLQDVCYLDLIDEFKNCVASAEDDLQLRAMICAYQGRFEDAADLYCKSGQMQKAMEMFADVHMFDEAKALAEQSSSEDSRPEEKVQELIQKQAEWTEEKQDHETAADMYLLAGQPEKALTLIVEHGPPSKLIEVVRRLKKTDKPELSLCAKLMRHHGLNSHALETYTKLGDLRSILSLHIDMKHWDDAFAMKTLHPELDIDVFSQYAEWLVSQAQYEKACQAYKQAGKQQCSMLLLGKLMNNAVMEKRFKDAAFYSLQLYHNYKDLSVEDQNVLERDFAKTREKAEIYYAYSFIDQSINEPFRTSTSEVLFNVSLFLLGNITKNKIPGISLVNILVTLSKYAEELGFFKAARSAYSQLQGLKIPVTWKDKLDVAALIVRARAALSDDSSGRLESPFCYCCASHVPVNTSSWKDACNVCSQPIIRSFISFDQLPIVEFSLQDGITHEKAIRLIGSQPYSVKPNTYLEEPRDQAKRATILQNQLFSSYPKSKPGPLVADENILISFQTRQVIIQNASKIQKTRYFYIIDPTFAAYQCSCCHHFFEQEEWDAVILRDGVCPFCRKDDSRVTSSWQQSC